MEGWPGEASVHYVKLRKIWKYFNFSICCCCSKRTVSRLKRNIVLSKWDSPASRKVYWNLRNRNDSDSENSILTSPFFLGFAHVWRRSDRTSQPRSLVLTLSQESRSDRGWGSFWGGFLSSFGRSVARPCLPFQLKVPITVRSRVGSKSRLSRPEVEAFSTFGDKTCWPWMGKALARRVSTWLMLA